MGWRVLRGRLGRAGGFGEREARQRSWDFEFGEGFWEIGYLLDGEFVPGAEASDRIYVESYRRHFDAHPEDLIELCALAKSIRNPHAEATSSVDLQVPAIERVLAERELTLSGRERVDIGTWKGQRSHALSERLSPLQVRCWIEPKRSLESFWQSRKRLAVWEPD